MTETEQVTLEQLLVRHVGSVTKRVTSRIIDARGDYKDVETIEVDYEYLANCMIDIMQGGEMVAIDPSHVACLVESWFEDEIGLTVSMNGITDEQWRQLGEYVRDNGGLANKAEVASRQRDRLYRRLTELNVQGKFGLTLSNPELRELLMDLEITAHI